MSENDNSISQIVSGIGLALGVISVGGAIAFRPETLEVSEQLQYVFTALFLGISVGHYLGEALVGNGEAIKNALLGFFSIMGIVFAGLIVFGFGITEFAGSLIGILVFWSSTLILGHYSDLIVQHQSLDEIVGVLAGKVSTSVLAVVAVSFGGQNLLGPETAKMLSDVAPAAIAVILFVFLMKYWEQIEAELQAVKEAIQSPDERRKRRK